MMAKVLAKYSTNIQTKSTYTDCFGMRNIYISGTNTEAIRQTQFKGY